MAKFYIVQKEIGLIFGSTISSSTYRGSSSGTYRVQPIGTVLELDSESPNGNVWFITVKGRERGKIECGEVNNLVKDGRISPLVIRRTK